MTDKKELKKIRAMASQLYTVEDIAETLKLSAENIENAVKSFNMVPKHREDFIAVEPKKPTKQAQKRVPDETRQVIAEYIKAGHTYRQAEIKFGVSRGTVANIVRKYKLSKREPVSVSAEASSKGPTSGTINNQVNCTAKSEKSQALEVDLVKIAFKLPDMACDSLDISAESVAFSGVLGTKACASVEFETGGKCYMLSLTRTSEEDA